MITGLVVSTFAGMKRVVQQKSGGFKLGLLIAVISGMTSPMLNMGFVYGHPILETARALGIPEELSTFPVWIVVLLGGFSINFGYAAYLLLRRKSFALFVKSTRFPLLVSITSGIIFFSSLAIYGAASSLLNALGTSVGWALLMSLVIVVSNVSGVLTGEWKGSKSALRYQLTSIVILIFGISTMGVSLYLWPSLQIKMPAIHPQLEQPSFEHDCEHPTLQTRSAAKSPTSTYH